MRSHSPWLPVLRTVLHPGAVLRDLRANPHAGGAIAHKFAGETTLGHPHMKLKARKCASTRPSPEVPGLLTRGDSVLLPPLSKEIP